MNIDDEELRLRAIEDLQAVREGLAQPLAGEGTPSDEFFKQFEAWLGQIDLSASASDLRASAAMRQRVFDLIAEEKKRLLLPPEKVELDGYMKVEHIMRMVKAATSQ